MYCTLPPLDLPWTFPIRSFCYFCLHSYVCVFVCWHLLQQKMGGHNTRNYCCLCAVWCMLCAFCLPDLLLLFTLTFHSSNSLVCTFSFGPKLCWHSQFGAQYISSFFSTRILQHTINVDRRWNASSTFRNLSSKSVEFWPQKIAPWCKHLKTIFDLHYRPFYYSWVMKLTLPDNFKSKRDSI